MTHIQSKTVKTSLDFHPNLHNNKVAVYLGKWGNEQGPDDNEYYVSIWGGDDTALQSEELTFKQAKKLYDSIQKVDQEEANLFKGSQNNNGFPSKR